MPSLSGSEITYLECNYWGQVLATIFVGCTFVQGYYYFHNYNDQWPIKALVLTVIILATLNWIFVVRVLFFYLVQNYDKPSALADMPWEYSAESAATYIEQALAQLFFARQIYMFDKKSWKVASIIVFFALCGLAFGMTVCGLLAQHSSLAYTGDGTLDIMGDLSVIMPTVCDFIATAAMWYFLGHKGKTALKTRSTVKSIQFLVLNRGILLITVQSIYLITWLVGETYWYWMPFHMVLPGIYANTMLVLLNERANIRAKENNINEIAVPHLISYSRQLSVFSSSQPSNVINLPELALRSVNHSHLDLSSPTTVTNLEEKPAKDPGLL